ncbi:MAG: 50S ribosomal protein L3 [Planctomycetes bacterium]|nr:50S ribosomal protein L3 [Planctomycetota bacterium]
MPIAILGKKIGMTRWFMEDGRNIPVTVIQAGPCVVTQVKTAESDGYAAVQLAFDDAKPRATTQQLIGHDAKAGSVPKRVHQELRLEKDEEASAYQLGQVVSVDTFSGLKFVDVSGTSKGKGFQGTMVRWNFKGICASHGTERKHRSPGSIGGGGTDRGTGPKLKKGKKMSGRMGGERTTVRSLDLISVDTEKNLLVVKGAVPGASNGYLFIRTPKRLYKTKAVLQAAK